MTRRPLVLLAATVVGTVLAAAPAQAAPYTVSMTLSASKADTGQTITISGSVAGSGAARKTVLVQRKVGSGAWTTVAKPTTTSARKYSVAHKVGVVGDQQFRVVAPTKGSTTTGVSAPRTLTGFTWLSLTQQPAFFSGSVLVGSSPVLVDVARPRSIELVTQSGGQPPSAFWDLYGACDRGSIQAATYTNTSVISVGADDAAPQIEVGSTQLTTFDFVSSQPSYLQIVNHGTRTIVIATPRVHCSVAQLAAPSL